MISRIYPHDNRPGENGVLVIMPSHFMLLLLEVESQPWLREGNMPVSPLYSVCGNLFVDLHNSLRFVKHEYLIKLLSSGISRQRCSDTLW